MPDIDKTVELITEAIGTVALDIERFTRAQSIEICQGVAEWVNGWIEAMQDEEATLTTDDEYRK
jgi:hypothetical protein